MDIILLFVALFGMIALGIPVAIALAGSSALFIIFFGSVPGMVVAHRMINGVDSFPLLAVPFFILAGALMNTAGITERIFTFALENGMNLKSAYHWGALFPDKVERIAAVSVLRG